MHRDPRISHPFVLMLCFLFIFNVLFYFCGGEADTQEGQRERETGDPKQELCSQYRA